MRKSYKCYIACVPIGNHKFPFLYCKNSDNNVRIVNRDIENHSKWRSFFYKQFFPEDSKLFSKTDMSEYLLIEGVEQSNKDGVIKIICDSSFTYSLYPEPVDIQSIPKGKQTAEQCLNAVKWDGLALQYVSKRFITESLCAKAVQQNGLALQYVPKDMIHTELAIAAIKQNKEATRYVPENVKRRKDVKKAMHQYGVIRITYKGYSKENGLFLVKGTSYANPDSPKDICRTFFTFDEFYRYLYGNLLNADLSDYDFDGIDLTAYNFDDIVIPADVWERAGLYDDSFYNENVRAYSEELKDKPSGMNELEPVKSTVPAKYNPENNYKDARFYYITDIHLDTKIIEKYSKRATEKEITCYIHTIVRKLVNSKNNGELFNRDHYLLIAGDVSLNYHFADIFYEELARLWGKPDNIVVILGNHEIRGAGLVENPLEFIIGKYQELFDRLGINFIHNDLLIKKDNGFIKITEAELRKRSEKELQTECSNTPFAILGSTGFSAYNPEHNATTGLYRYTMLTMEEDKEQADRFGEIYTKVENALHEKKMIVLTHMLKTDWLPGVFCNNWIYVSGHTHTNTLIINRDVTLYADNQVGYTNTAIGLKSFLLSMNYDVFLFYEDGIHEITREQYCDFNHSLGIKMQLNRSNIKIYMLKRKGIYCFIQKKVNCYGLYILNGGQARGLDRDDLQYYYNNMVKYATLVCCKMEKPNQLLKQIAKEVISFGGSGHIHGCIVDIDYLNHIYLNPYDGTITPYYATSITDKYAYNDLLTLLSERCPQLYGNYIKIIEEKSEDLILLKPADIVMRDDVHYVRETDIYRPSRVIRSLQYTTDHNIIRTWDEDFLKAFEEELDDNENLIFLDGAKQQSSST